MQTIETKKILILYGENIKKINNTLEIIKKKFDFFEIFDAASIAEEALLQKLCAYNLFGGRGAILAQNLGCIPKNFEKFNNLLIICGDFKIEHELILKIECKNNSTNDKSNYIKNLAIEYGLKLSSAQQSLLIKHLFKFDEYFIENEIKKLAACKNFSQAEMLALLDAEQTAYIENIAKSIESSNTALAIRIFNKIKYTYPPLMIIRVIYKYFAGRPCAQILKRCLECEIAIKAAPKRASATLTRFILEK